MSDNIWPLSNVKDAADLRLMNFNTLQNDGEKRNKYITRIQLSPYFQLLTRSQLLTVFEQSIFGNSYASNVKAYFQLLTHSQLLTLSEILVLTVGSRECTWSAQSKWTSF